MGFFLENHTKTKSTGVRGGGGGNSVRPWHMLGLPTCMQNSGYRHSFIHSLTSLCFVPFSCLQVPYQIF